MASKIQRWAAADRHRQLLRVATEMFARRGFRGTTTRQIAERARVNEAILFRHFPNKHDLYWAVIDEKCRARPARAALERQLAAGTDDRALFTAIAADLLERNTADSSLTRLLLFSGLEHHELSDRFFRTYVAGYYQLLADYIRRRVRSGEFRAMNPLLAARGFLGMVIYHLLVQELFATRAGQEFAVSEVSQTLANLWLEGMRTRPARAGHGRKVLS